MCLVALQDPGLTVFPTHRLLTGLDDDKRQALREAIQRDCEMTEIDADDLQPTAAADGRIALGYLDAHHRRPLRLTLKDQAIADAALPDMPEPYRRLDTAVLEALILKGALGMSEDDISHLHGLDYARDTAEARERVEAGEADAAFFMRPTPVEQVRDVAAAGREHAAEVDLLLPEGADGRCCSTRSPKLSDRMRAIARQREKFTHDLKVRQHRLTADEPDGSGRRGHRARARRSCWPPRSPRAPRSRSRCTPSARAGTSTGSRSTSTTRPPSAAARRTSSSSCGCPPTCPRSRSSACR